MSSASKFEQHPEVSKRSTSNSEAVSKATLGIKQHQTKSYTIWSIVLTTGVAAILLLLFWLAICLQRLTSVVMEMKQNGVLR